METRQQRLRRERKAERVAVWDPGEPTEGRTLPKKGYDPLRPRWRLIHPDPYGGHGSATAVSVCGCQCRECLARGAAERRAWLAARRPAGGGRGRRQGLCR